MSTVSEKSGTRDSTPPARFSSSDTKPVNVSCDLSSSTKFRDMA